MDVLGIAVHATMLLEEDTWRCSNGLELMDVVGPLIHAAVLLEEVIWKS
jgi:hypothetical protein